MHVSVLLPTLCLWTRKEAKAACLLMYIFIYMYTWCAHTHTHKCTMITNIIVGYTDTVLLPCYHERSVANVSCPAHFPASNGDDFQSSISPLSLSNVDCYIAFSLFFSLSLSLSVSPSPAGLPQLPFPVFNAQPKADRQHTRITHTHAYTYTYTYTYVALDT